MSFERIKTIKGKKYGYTVESFREAGKTKQRILKYHGRVDKEPVSNNCLRIPYGIYYFAQDGCGACSSEDDIQKEFDKYRRHSEKAIPELIYINLSKDKNPLPLAISSTPTFIFIGKEKMYVGEWYTFIKAYIGKEKIDSVVEAVLKEETDSRNAELQEHICAGKKYRELISLGYSKEEIRIGMGKPAKTEKELLKEKEEEERNIKIYEECDRRVKEKAACKDGVCQLPQSNANVTTT